MRHFSPKIGFLSILAFVLTLWGTHVSATVIGTLSDARAGVQSRFDLFDGDLLDLARGALGADGHSLVNLDAGISAGSLSGIDTVYLPVPVFGPPPAILAASEAQALFDFVVGGGNLIVQGDTINFGPAYNNVASLFGLQYVGGIGDFDVVTLTGAFPGLTSGPFGDADQLRIASTGGIDPGVASGLSLLDLPGGQSFLYVLAPETGFAGLGRAVFLTDVNSFDDPENTGGWNLGDGEIFWRNMFATPARVPAPGTLVLFSTGAFLIGFAGLRGHR